MAQWLKATVALAEDLGSVSGIHMMAHGRHNSCSRGSDALC